MTVELNATMFNQLLIILVQFAYTSGRQGHDVAWFYDLTNALNATSP